MKEPSVETKIGQILAEKFGYCGACNQGHAIDGLDQDGDPNYVGKCFCLQPHEEATEQISALFSTQQAQMREEAIAKYKVELTERMEELRVKRTWNAKEGEEKYHNRMVADGTMFAVLDEVIALINEGEK